MEQDKDFLSMIQEIPEYKNIVQNVQANIKHQDEETMLEKEHQFRFILFRYIHLRLIHSILVLLEYEPDSYIELIFPYRHFKIGISTERDESNRMIYTLETFRNGGISGRFSFWNKNHLAKNLITNFLEKFPRKASVWRSSVSMTDTSIHTFVHNIENAFNETKVPKRLTSIYNQQYKERLL
jgi:hypothetical protein